MALKQFNIDIFKKPTAQFAPKATAGIDYLDLGWGEGFRAGFESEGSALNIVDTLSQRLHRATMPKDPHFKITPDLWEKYPLFNENPGLLFSVRSEHEAAYVHDNWMRKREQREKLQRAKPLSALGFGMVGAFLDPINLIPFGVGKTFGKTILHGVKLGAGAGLAGGATAEALLLASQQDRTFEEAAFGTLMSGAFGGVLGAVGGGLSRATYRRKMAALNHHLNRPESDAFIIDDLVYLENEVVRSEIQGRNEEIWKAEGRFINREEILDIFKTHGDQYDSVEALEAKVADDDRILITRVMAETTDTQLSGIAGRGDAEPPKLTIEEERGLPWEAIPQNAGAWERVLDDARTQEVRSTPEPQAAMGPDGRPLPVDRLEGVAARGSARHTFLTEALNSADEGVKEAAEEALGHLRRSDGAAREARTIADLASQDPGHKWNFWEEARTQHLSEVIRESEAEYGALQTWMKERLKIPEEAVDVGPRVTFWEKVQSAKNQLSLQNIRDITKNVIKYRQAKRVHANAMRALEVIRQDISKTTRAIEENQRRIASTIPEKEKGIYERNLHDLEEARKRLGPDEQAAREAERAASQEVRIRASALKTKVRQAADEGKRGPLRDAIANAAQEGKEAEDEFLQGKFVAFRFHANERARVRAKLDNNQKLTPFEETWNRLDQQIWSKQREYWEQKRADPPADQAVLDALDTQAKTLQQTLDRLAEQMHHARQRDAEDFAPYGPGQEHSGFDWAAMPRERLQKLKDNYLQELNVRERLENWVPHVYTSPGPQFIEVGGRQFDLNVAGTEKYLEMLEALQSERASILAESGAPSFITPQVRNQVANAVLRELEREAADLRATIDSFDATEAEYQGYVNLAERTRKSMEEKRSRNQNEEFDLLANLLRDTERSMRQLDHAEASRRGKVGLEQSLRSTEQKIARVQEAQATDRLAAPLTKPIRRSITPPAGKKWVRPKAAKRVFLRPAIDKKGRVVRPDLQELRAHPDSRGPWIGEKQGWVDLGWRGEAEWEQFGNPFRYRMGVNDSKYVQLTETRQNLDIIRSELDNLPASLNKEQAALRQELLQREKVVLKNIGQLEKDIASGKQEPLPDGMREVDSELEEAQRFLTWLEGKSDTDFRQDQRRWILANAKHMRGKQAGIWKFDQAKRSRTAHIIALEMLANRSTPDRVLVDAKLPDGEVPQPTRQIPTPKRAPLMKVSDARKLPVIDQANKRIIILRPVRGEPPHAHFGNPWSRRRKGKQTSAAFEAENDIHATNNMFEWLMGDLEVETPKGHPYDLARQREWILEQIDQGVLDEMELVCGGTHPNYKHSMGCHADALIRLWHIRKGNPTQLSDSPAIHTIDDQIAEANWQDDLDQLVDRGETPKFDDSLMGMDISPDQLPKYVGPGEVAKDTPKNRKAELHDNIGAVQMRKWQQENEAGIEALGADVAGRKHVVLFGDNWARQGTGGQAKYGRPYQVVAEGEQQPGLAIGIRTKKSPREFISDADYDDAILAIEQDIREVMKAIDEGATVHVPRAGLGTGLAQLQQRAPRVYDYLQKQMKLITDLAGESQEPVRVAADAPNIQAPLPTKIVVNAEPYFSEVLNQDRIAVLDVHWWSGGTTGADHGWLDAGKEIQQSTGGWMPYGWLRDVNDKALHPGGNRDRIAGWEKRKSWADTYGLEAKEQRFDRDGKPQAGFAARTRDNVDVARATVLFVPPGWMETPELFVRQSPGTAQTLLYAAMEPQDYLSITGRQKPETLWGENLLEGMRKMLPKILAADGFGVGKGRKPYLLIDMAMSPQDAGMKIRKFIIDHNLEGKKRINAAGPRESSYRAAGALGPHDYVMQAGLYAATEPFQGRIHAAKGVVGRVSEFLGGEDAGPDGKWSYGRVAPEEGGGYEVSSAGDSRFSAFNAVPQHFRITRTDSVATRVYGSDRVPGGQIGKMTAMDGSIEAIYQTVIKGYETPAAGKGKPAPGARVSFGGRDFDTSSPEQLYQAYKHLWRMWAKDNPELMQQLADNAQGKMLTDKFATGPNSQARALAGLLNEMMPTHERLDLTNLERMTIDAQNIHTQMDELERRKADAQETGDEEMLDFLSEKIERLENQLTTLDGVRYGVEKAPHEANRIGGDVAQLRGPSLDRQFENALLRISYEMENATTQQELDVYRGQMRRLVDEWARRSGVDIRDSDWLDVFTMTDEQRDIHVKHMAEGEQMYPFDLDDDTMNILATASGDTTMRNFEYPSVFQGRPQWSVDRMLQQAIVGKPGEEVEIYLAQMGLDEEALASLTASDFADPRTLLVLKEVLSEDPGMPARVFPSIDHELNLAASQAMDLRTEEWIKARERERILNEPETTARSKAILKQIQDDLDSYYNKKEEDHLKALERRAKRWWFGDKEPMRRWWRGYRDKVTGKWRNRGGPEGERFTEARARELMGEALYAHYKYVERAKGPPGEEFSVARALQLMEEAEAASRIRSDIEIGNEAAKRRGNITAARQARQRASKQSEEELLELARLNAARRSLNQRTQLEHRQATDEEAATRVTRVAKQQEQMARQSRIEEEFIASEDARIADTNRAIDRVQEEKVQEDAGIIDTGPDEAEVEDAALSREKYLSEDLQKEIDKHLSPSKFVVGDEERAAHKAEAAALLERARAEDAQPEKTRLPEERSADRPRTERYDKALKDEMSGKSEQKRRKAKQRYNMMDQIKGHLEGRANEDGITLVWSAVESADPGRGRIMANYNRKTKVITIDPELAMRGWNEKAWTKPQVEDVKPLPEDQFRTPHDWITFLYEHELAHSRWTELEWRESEPTGTKGEYENWVNEKAVRAMDEGESVPEAPDEAMPEGAGLILTEAEMPRFMGPSGDAPPPPERVPNAPPPSPGDIPLEPIPEALGPRPEELAGMPPVDDAPPPPPAPPGGQGGGPPSEVPEFQRPPITPTAWLPGLEDTVARGFMKGDKLGLAFYAPQAWLLIKSPSKVAKRIFVNLIETDLYFDRNYSGVGVNDTTVQMGIKVWQSRGRLAIRETEDSFARWVLGLPALAEGEVPRGNRLKAFIARFNAEGAEQIQEGGKRDFYEWVTEAIRNKGRAAHGTPKEAMPHVERAAKAIRERIFIPIHEEMQKLGIPVATDPLSYVMRLYDITKIKNNKSQFIQEVFDDLIDQAKLRGDQITAEVEVKYRELVEGWTENILSTPYIRQPDAMNDLVGTTGIHLPMQRTAGRLERTRKVEASEKSLRPWLRNDIGEILNAYMHTRVPDLELAKKFGHHSMKQQIDAIRAEYAELIDEAPDDVAKQKLKRAMARDINIIEGTRDVMRGVNALPADPDSMIGMMQRGGRFMRGFNYVRIGGGFGVVALGDVGGTVLANGLMRTVGGFMSELTNGLNSHFKYMSNRDLLYLGLDFNDILNERMGAIMDAGDYGGLYSLPENWMHEASRKMSIVNMMTAWTNFARTVAARGVVRRMIEMAERSLDGGLRQHEIAALNRAHISVKDLADIYHKWSLYGGRDKNRYWLGVENWNNKVLAAKVRDAILSDVDRAVVQPAPGDTLLFADSHLGKILFQFRRFGLAHTMKVLSPSLQQLRNGDLTLLSGLAMGVAMGAMVYQIKTFMNKRKVDTDVGKVIQEGVVRADLWGAIAEYDGLISAASAGRYGLMQFLGPDTHHAYRSKSPMMEVAKRVLGPSFGTVLEGIRFGGAIEELMRVGPDEGFGTMTRQEFHSLRKMLPLQNLVYMDFLFDEISNTAERKHATQAARMHMLGTPR